MLTPTDPLFTLQITNETPGGSAVTGVCFVGNPTEKSNIIATDDCDSDENEDCDFKCSSILLDPHRNPSLISSSIAAATHLSAATHSNLQGYTLASCHHDGICKIWDLSSRRCIVEDINPVPERKFGLAVRRLNDASNRFLYQTRDEHGTVTLHDLHDPSIKMTSIQTNSTTFCTISPCQVGVNASGGVAIRPTDIGGESNLVALPTEFHSVAVVRDLRCDPTRQPSYRICVGQYDDSDTTRYNYYGRDNKYGMLMSLALSVQHDTQKLVLGCGMEDGTALFYDLGNSKKGHMCSKNKEGNDIRLDGMTDSAVATKKKSRKKFMCGTKLGKDPVLSLDLATSYADGKNKKKSPSSLIAVAGCAGDADDLCDLPEEEQGTVTSMKVSLIHDDNETDSVMKSTIRGRTHTCSISSGGKVGVSIARFRPDGRIFAVGGWDRRLRIFGRTSSKLLAVLHGGHSNSIVAMDWASDSAMSGLLATGAGDGKICVYRVLPHSLKQV